MAGASTPDQIAADWASRLGGSTDKIKRGIQAVSVAPGQAAARQKAVYLQNVTQNVDKWARNVASVPLSAWQQAAIDKGLGRIGTGAQAAQGRFAQFMGALLPHIETGRNALPARGGLDQNINRMVQFTRHMATFRRPAG